MRHQVLQKQLILAKPEVFLDGVCQQLQHIHSRHWVSPVHLEVILGDLDHLSLPVAMLDEVASLSLGNTNNKDGQV